MLPPLTLGDGLLGLVPLVHLLWDLSKDSLSLSCSVSKQSILPQSHLGGRIVSPAPAGTYRFDTSGTSSKVCTCGRVFETENDFGSDRCLC